MITKEQAIEQLIAIEEFSKNLREFLLGEPEVTVNTTVELPKPPKKEEEAPKEPEFVADLAEDAIPPTEEVEDEVDLPAIIEEFGLNEMTIPELKELLDEYSVEYNKRSKKVEYFAELVAQCIADGTIPTEDEESEEEEPAEEAEEITEPEEIEEKTAETITNSKRVDEEDKIENELRTNYANKKLKDTEMKKFLKNYYEGDPDCADCKGCSKEEVLQCYIDIKTSFVDDDGNRIDPEEKEAYIRDGEVYCCGKPCQMLENGHYMCEICGSEFEE